MRSEKIVAFAVLGHPNEGKSSVVSTLTEDDSVKISATPGETVKCRAFPVSIDGIEIIRFTDTPGFQYPKKTLEWFRNYEGEKEKIVQAFVNEHKKSEQFKHECEL